MPRFPLLLVCCLLLPVSASAAIYRYTDEHGNQVFTNQPPINAPAQEVELSPPNLIQGKPEPQAPAAAPAGEEEAQDKSAQEPFGGYEQLQILGVPPVVRGSVLTVEVLVVPALRSGHRLRLELDGASQGEPSDSTSFTVTGIERGNHSLRAVIVSDEGDLRSSASVEFTRQQIGMNSPARSGN